MQTLKDWWWLLGVLLLILGSYWKLAVSGNKAKERLNQVEENKKAIKALQTEMTTIKEDISDIKEGVDKQAEDTAAILSSLQSILNALCESNSNVSPARDKFNDYLANR